ncbi:TPA_asm: hypothetical protein [Altiarchaeum virus]|nr:TPA_asm: hypothetical protein [Altiarchaeum virus]
MRGQSEAETKSTIKFQKNPCEKFKISATTMDFQVTL